MILNKLTPYTGEEISALITKGASPRWQGFEYCSDGFLFVTSENVRDGYLDISSPKFLPIAFNDSHKRSQLKTDDILINIVGASIGRSCQFLERDKVANINQAVCLLRVKPDHNAKYIAYYLQLPKMVSFLKGSTSDGARPNLSLADIKSLNLLLPPLAEQERIAEILSTWDKAIETTEALLATARAQKRALMQTLLTGKHRFPEFEGQEWREVRLGDVGSISSAGVDKKSNPNEPEVRLLNFLDVFNREFIKNHELTHSVTAPAAKVKQCNVQRGDVFFTPSSETRDEIAIPAVAVEDMPGVCYSYHVVRFRLHEDWDMNFRAFTFQTDDFRRQAYRLGDGSGQRYVISQDHFRKMTVRIPRREEQKRIGEVLALASEEVDRLEGSIEKLRAEKKALMQQLLTGKRRVRM